MTSRRGFTLIELMVSLTIVLLMVGVAVAGYVTANRRQIVATGTQQVVSALRLAQKRASVGDKPASCVSPTVKTLNGYRFTIPTAGGAGYEVAAVCDGVAQTPPVVSENLPAGAVFVATGNVQFGTAQGVVSGSALPFTITVRESGSSGHQQVITVTTLGVINEQPIGNF